MVSKWEGGAPSDAHEWIEVLFDALGEEASFYWVRFYQKPGGWRFDLERRFETPGPGALSSYRRADESTALRVFTSLVEDGKPLDPSWTPSAASPLAEVVRMPRRAHPPARTALVRGENGTEPEGLPPDTAPAVEPVSITLPAQVPEPLPPSASAPPLAVFELRKRTPEMLPPNSGGTAGPISVALPAQDQKSLPPSVSAPPLTVLETPEPALETPPPDSAALEMPAPDRAPTVELASVVVPAQNPEPLPPAASAVPLTVLEATEAALEMAPTDREPVEPVSAALPTANPEPPPLSASAPPLAAFEAPEAALEMPAPHAASTSAGSVVHPAPTSRRLRRPVLTPWVVRRFPDWRSVGPVLVYTAAILLLAWGLSRARLPWSAALPPQPAAQSQAAQTRLEEPEGIAHASKSAQASPVRGARGSTQRLTGQPGQPSRRGDEVRPPKLPPPPRRGQLVDLNDPGVRPPVLVSRTGRPPYPPLALARGLSGTVWLDALVDETGRVVEIALVRTSAPGLGLEDAAMRYVNSRVYRPATKRGVRVRVRLPIKVEFQLPAR